MYFMQKNSLDRRNRTLTIEARNVTFSSRIEVVETCIYYVSLIFLLKWVG